MMGQKTVEPELYINFSLDAAVPPDHLVRQLASCVDFSFIRPLVRPLYSHTGQPSVDPVVLFKLALLGYLYNIRSERQMCEEAGLNLAWRWFLGYELTEPIPDHSVLVRTPSVPTRTVASTSATAQVKQLSAPDRAGPGGVTPLAPPPAP